MVVAVTVTIEEGAEKGVNDGEDRKVSMEWEELAPAHGHGNDPLSSWFLLNE